MTGFGFFRPQKTRKEQKKHAGPTKIGRNNAGEPPFFLFELTVNELMPAGNSDEKISYDAQRYQRRGIIRRFGQRDQEGEGEKAMVTDGYQTRPKM
jgi:hypothetical protein